MTMMKSGQQPLFNQDRYHVVYRDGTNFTIPDLDQITIEDQEKIQTVLDLKTNAYSHDLKSWHDIRKYDPDQNALV